jgi:hypothetical protein
MKRIILVSFAALSINIIQAGYMLNFPLESNNGGHIQSGSIQFKPTTEAPTDPEVPTIPETPSENWLVISPEYSEWIDSGAITGCNNWSPEPSTVNLGESFNQTATNCQQSQTRSIQEREQESTTKAIRYKGIQSTEDQIIVVSSSRTNTGTKAQPECDYKWHNYSDYSNNSYYYLGYDNYFGYGWGTAIYWKGATIFDNPVHTNLTSVVSGGYRYYMGPLVNAEQSTYQVCRIAI